MSTSIVLVDAHVHVHSSASVGTLLASAVSNFSRKATQLGQQRWQGVLLLAEMRGVDWFASLDQVAPNLPEGWHVTASSQEPTSLWLRCDAAELLVVAGRQIVSAEGIEVLALGTRQHISYGQPLLTTIDQVRGSNAVVVLPWGVGKWLGHRGRLVARALASATNDHRVLAGDNGGRPRFWPSPSVFKLAASRGHPVVPGTDPLPLSGEERQVGRVGFWTPGELPAETPFAALRAVLLAVPAVDVHPYGRRESVFRFFRNQLALRIKKNSRRAA